MKRIERIVDLYREEERTKSMEMADCQKYYDEQLDTYTRLIEYALEYKKEHARSAAEGISASMIANYNNFMARLRLTTDQQTLVLENAQHELENAVQQWKLTRSKKMILVKLNDRLDKERSYNIDRREQSLQDDAAAARCSITRPQRLLD